MRFKVELFWGKLGPNCPFVWKGDFLRKLTNATIVYLLHPIMLQILKKVLSVGQIMSYKVLQFWVKLNTNYQFTLKEVFFFFFFFFEKLTDADFVHFMYPIKILQCLEKIIKVNHKIQGCIIFGQIGLGYFLGENWLSLLLSICCAPSY